MKIKGFEIRGTSPGEESSLNNNATVSRQSEDTSIIVPDPVVPDQETINISFTFIHEIGAPNSYGGVKGYFKYNGTDTTVTIPNEIKGYILKDAYKMFSYPSSVKKVINTNPNITNMSKMFFNSRATTLDLSNFNTSNVTDMSGMFYGSSATTLDLSSFNTSNVTNMTYMFAYSKAITLDLSSFNTSKVTDMSHMFQNSKATELDLSPFNTSNVTDISWMFTDSEATTIDLSSFDTSKVTDMLAMFEGSSATTGYARTQSDADRFNGSKYKPQELTFAVK